MPEWQGAFAVYAASHPGCGQPLADIQYLPPTWQRAYQYSASTVLVYDGQVFACPVPGAAPPAPLFFEDWDYVNVGPLLVKYAAQHHTTIQGLIGLIHTESGFNTNAVRRQAWPDVSGGYSQMTVATAAGYGIGNGTSTDTNIEYVLNRLCDRETGIRLAAEHFESCLRSVDDTVRPAPVGDERLICGMRAYNGGAGYGLTDAYATKYAAHIAGYRGALDLTYKVLRDKPYPADPV